MIDLKFKRSGLLYVPEREPVRRYSPRDLDRFERYKHRHQPRLAFTVVVNTIATSGDANSVTTSGINTTGANLIILGTGTTGAPVVTDSNGNTWTGLTAVDGDFSCRARIFYAFNPTVGAGHTFTNTLTGQLPSISVLALSGSASSPFDQQNGAASGPGNTGQPGSVTPTENDEILICITSHFGSDTRSIDSGFSTSDQITYNGFGTGLAMFYKIQTTAGAENPTVSWTNSGISYPIVIATFKSGAAVTKSFPHSFQNNLGNLMMR